MSQSSPELACTVYADRPHLQKLHLPRQFTLKSPLGIPDTASLIKCTMSSAGIQSQRSRGRSVGVTRSTVMYPVLIVPGRYQIYEAPAKSDRLLGVLGGGQGGELSDFGCAQGRVVESDAAEGALEGV